MTFVQLKEFLTEKMRMSHIYQPVMIKRLLKNNGISKDEEIAMDISMQDPSQIEYYKNVTNNMVGKVLRSHNIVDKVKKIYTLNGYEELTTDQILELIDICNRKLEAYIDKRGEYIWQHRLKSREPISGSVKYQVLKRARFRCELCGISAFEKALEVDHIVPKNLNGEDSINNYQALCYSCNAMKRDHDSTDFRRLDELYAHRAENCLFCNIPSDRIVAQNNLAYLIYDQFPVTRFHMLIIPKRHFPEYFEIQQSELNAIQELLQKGKGIAIQQDKRIVGYNIGINSGIAAGQTILHCHTHLIPRRENDVENPRGGIRHVIADKGYY